MIASRFYLVGDVENFGEIFLQKPIHFFQVIGMMRKDVFSAVLFDKTSSQVVPGEFTTVLYNDVLEGFVVVGLHGFDFLDDTHTLEDLSKDNVFAIQMRRWDSG